MPRPQDWIGRHAQPRRRTAAGTRTGGGAFQSFAQGRAGTSEAVWDVSTWDNCVWGPGGEATWDDSTWGGGDLFADETTGRVGYWGMSYWRRCEFAD